MASEGSQGNRHGATRRKTDRQIETNPESNFKNQSRQELLGIPLNPLRIPLEVHSHGATKSQENPKGYQNGKSFLVDVSDIFFSAWGRGKGNPRRQEGSGSALFIENPRGGLPGERGRARGLDSVCRNRRRGGG